MVDLQTASSPAPRMAHNAFDAAVLALGFVIDGQEVAPDKRYALSAFTKATELDPMMCDAWLGRLVAGESSPRIIFEIYRTRERMGREQSRFRLPDRSLCGRFETGMYVDYPLSTPSEAALAYAASCITQADYHEAEAVLDEFDVAHHSVEDSQSHIAAYVRGVLHFATKRWPDVLVALANSESWPDIYLRAGADAMCGSACAQLGMFTEAIRRLESAVAGPIEAALMSSKLCHGLVLREMGDEDKARENFEWLYAKDPSFTANAQALANPGYRLVITDKESIDSRTDKWDPESAPAKPAADVQAQECLLATASQELDEQIGLDEVKIQVAKLRSSAALAKVRSEKGLATSSRSLHLAFTGPPGTGKTTVARIVAKIYCGLGLLASDKVIEAKRKDFVGQHLGSTALKTSALIDSALDGVLFIDEAYTLIQEGLSGGDAFGQEAVDTLLARMEDDRSRLVVIIAGYDADIDRFLASNDGLSSRFGRRIRFDSYNTSELIEIAHAMAGKRDARLADAAVAVLGQVCEALCQETSSGRRIDSAGNGRFIRNVVELAEEEREFRLSRCDDVASLDEEALMTISVDDMTQALTTLNVLR